MHFRYKHQADKSLFLLQIVVVFLLIDYCIISFMRVENEWKDWKY